MYDLSRFKVGYARRDLDAERELARIEVGSRVLYADESVLYKCWLAMGDRAVPFDTWVKRGCPMRGVEDG